VAALSGVSGLPYAHGMTLPFSEARALAEDARARALALGQALSVTVVDYGGFIVLIERLDGARSHQQKWRRRSPPAPRWFTS
jgi:uncharacterized protein GlcG (DUF336 family)